MKLRTVLSALKASSYVEGPDVDVNADVIVFPGAPLEEAIPEMLVLVTEGKTVANKDYPGLALVYAGAALPDIVHRPAERTVIFASPLGKQELEEEFAALPQLHVYLDLQRKRIFRAFQSSYDIQRFADLTHEIFGNPLIIINSDHRLLASSGEFPKDRPDVLEEITQGYLFEGVNAELEKAGILDDVRHAGHSIISENERFGQRWVTSIIMYHHMEVGRFDMLEQDRLVSDSDLELVDFAGSLAGILIDKLGIAGKRAGSGSSVLDDILSNKFGNEKTMRAQLASSSMPLDGTYVIVELAGEREIPRAHLQRIAARVTNAFRNSLWTAREGRLVTMIALGKRTCVGWDCYERAEHILKQRKDFVVTLERNGLMAYVSEPFEELELASERYRQVSDLMAANVDQEGRIVCFWHHRYAVLTSLGRTFGQVDMMLDKRVVAMDLYDREHGTAYLETARRTVEFPGSPAEAAKALNVHRNTYFYRVNKIAELFFLDLKCGDDRLAVAFSTHVLASMGGTVLFDVDDIPEVRRRIMTPTGH